MQADQMVPVMPKNVQFGDNMARRASGRLEAIRQGWSRHIAAHYTAPS